MFSIIYLCKHTKNNQMNEKEIFLSRNKNSNLNKNKLKYSIL